ncbi:hypothetical protein [Gelidibacter salicanalis]|uniref:Uncharacterized protein n=1 Tax=Gelidibacter salicanalis TaxID=291193 RepID=A0A934KZU0_9FLAO|nr:hypothetical protein [Gelidibacter salicanalis]MBJ7882685.1 hypothetical protein [Gelidibacter salicanalis]
MNSEITYKILKMVALILLFSYALDKVVFFSFNKMSDKVMTGQAIGKLNHFLSKKDSADFIVFGNSRANRHIDVDLFSTNGFNMGTDGVGIAYNSALISTLPIKSKQLILVHIDTKNFFDNDYDGSDITALKTKYQRNDDITKALKESGQLSVLQKFYSSINYNGNAIGIIKNFLRPSYNFHNYNGYDPIIVSEMQASMRDQVLSKADTPQECKDDHKVNKVALHYLESIAAFIDITPHKTFLFVTSPLYNDSCDIDNIKLNNIMQNLGLTYWDFSNLYKDEKNNAYWKDATHMTKNGAEAFSTYLSQQYKEKILK